MGASRWSERARGALALETRLLRAGAGRACGAGRRVAAVPGGARGDACHPGRTHPAAPASAACSSSPRPAQRPCTGLAAAAGMTPNSHRRCVPPTIRHRPSAQPRRRTAAVSTAYASGLQSPSSLGMLSSAASASPCAKATRRRQRGRPTRAVVALRTKSASSCPSGSPSTRALEWKPSNSGSAAQRSGNIAGEHSSSMATSTALTWAAILVQRFGHARSSAAA